ncbi:unnamed protein product [Nezara viridula]|uniref:Uncharacterized protein n=1 Tax=Nezara viridula TaxID=85310 RepID=A0A9P0H749_NEZVI|nr:unnamed protein product [Nezara viridula]
MPYPALPSICIYNTFSVCRSYALLTAPQREPIEHKRESCWK